MSVLKSNRPFFMFLAKFTLSYLLLSGIYWLYLEQFDADKHEPDGVTHMVAKQAMGLCLILGEQASIEPHDKEASYRFRVNGKRVARIVEGCNAVSVMILFTAFIIAFSSTVKRTALFIIAGIVIIHLLNIARVGLLCIAYFHYPEYQKLLHDIVFPLFIYGVVFVLWLLWVLKFSGNAYSSKNK